MFSVTVGETLRGNQRKSLHNRMQGVCWGRAAREGNRVNKKRSKR